MEASPPRECYDRIEDKFARERDLRLGYRPEGTAQHTSDPTGGIYNRIVGQGRLDLNDEYRDGMRTLLGIHSHGYPNLFVMGGYQASFKFNLTDVLRTQGDHIARCIRHARAHGHRTIDATPA